jgi:hypothetical protein
VGNRFVNVYIDRFEYILMKRARDKNVSHVSRDTLHALCAASRIRTNNTVL